MAERRFQRDRPVWRAGASGLPSCARLRFEIGRDGVDFHIRATNSDNGQSERSLPFVSAVLAYARAGPEVTHASSAIQPSVGPVMCARSMAFNTSERTGLVM